MGPNETPKMHIILDMHCKTAPKVDVTYYSIPMLADSILASLND